MRRVGLAEPTLLAALACTPALAEEQDPDTEVAQRFFRAGAAAYETRDYATAVTAFLNARRIRPLPALDYNIGRCYDRMGRWADALVSYERFLAFRPPGPEAREIQERVAQLKVRLALETAPAAKPAPETSAAREVPAPAPATSAPAAPPPAARTPAPPAVTAPPRPEPAGHGPGFARRFALPLAAGGLAIASGAAAFGLYFAADSEYRALEDAQTGCRPCGDAQLGGFEARSRAFYALGAIAGAAAIADVVLWVVTARARRGDQRAAAIVPSGRGMVVRF